MVQLLIVVLVWLFAGLKWALGAAVVMVLLHLMGDQKQ